MAEQLSAAGVPVVMADVKGDLSGLSKPGEPGERITARVADTGDDWAPTGFPVEFLSLGHDGFRGAGARHAPASARSCRRCLASTPPRSRRWA